MTRTQAVAIAAFVSGVAGLVILELGDGGLASSVIGAVLAVGAAIGLLRHLWRESNRKRSDELAKAFSKLLTNLEVLEGRIVSLEADLPSRKDIQQIQFTLENEVVTQMSGVIGVYSILSPSFPLIPFGRSAIAGDCALRLVRLVLALKPRWVIEAGSGLSTVVIARALELIGEGGVVISLEHKLEWAEDTRAMVGEQGLQQHSRVVVAPLVPIEVGGEEFLWYDLAEVALPDEIDLLFVDGPPGKSGSLARYPAVPLLFDRLKQGGVILLDDANRAEEQSIVRRWSAEFSSLSVRFHKDLKGTAEISKR